MIPTFLKDGSPTDQTLEQISDWLPSHGTWEDFLSFCRECFDETYGTWEEGPSEIHISCGGWSSNEAILGHMCSNPLFTGLFWQSSARGGHHVFSRPKKPED